jgi:2,3-dihydroxyethylbenzene 1,2-dioxygenase
MENPVSLVTELGYVGIGVKDGDAWKSYASDIVGMEVSDEGEQDRFYLRLDNWHHRIVVHANDEDDLMYVGWRVPWPDDLDAIARRLGDAGIEYKVGGKEEAEERRVLGLLKLTDPGGNAVEIFYGPQIDAHRPFRPGRGLHGRFVTGNRGMGHLILREDDVEAAFKFYRLLGLQGSLDARFILPNGVPTTPVFMHCNDRQHSLAFGLGSMPKRINHLMVEYTHLDDLGLAHDIANRRKVDIAVHLGKHANDEALTFYMATPSAWLLELAWGARPTPAQQEYSVSDIFGHQPGAKGYGFDAMDFGHTLRPGEKSSG